MPDQSFEILIKTKAELAGANAALAAMEKHIGALKVQGKATADLEAQLARGRAAVDAFTQANGEAGEKTGFLQNRLEGVKNRLKDVAAAFTLAGQAAKAFTKPFDAGHAATENRREPDLPPVEVRAPAGKRADGNIAAAEVQAGLSAVTNSTSDKVAGLANAISLFVAAANTNEASLARIRNALEAFEKNSRATGDYAAAIAGRIEALTQKVEQALARQTNSTSKTGQP